MYAVWVRAPAAAENAKGKARTAYKDFLNLWKNADPDRKSVNQIEALAVFGQDRSEHACDNVSQFLGR